MYGTIKITNVTAENPPGEIKENRSHHCIIPKMYAVQPPCEGHRVAKPLTSRKHESACSEKVKCKRVTKHMTTKNVLLLLLWAQSPWVRLNQTSICKYCRYE